MTDTESRGTNETGGGTGTKARQTKSWRTTGKDRLNPQPVVYPVCATCEQPWIYKRFLGLSSGGYLWGWGRDCKHKGTPRAQDDTASDGEATR